MSTPFKSPSPAAAGGVFGRFFDWWLAELAAFVPSLRWGGARRQIVLDLSAGPAATRLLDVRGRKSIDLLSTPGKSTGAELQSRENRRDAVLAELSRDRDRPEIVLLLPREAVFSRWVELPAAAAADAGRILALDLEQATPFRRRDVLIAHRVLDRKQAAAPPGRVVAEQYVIKRATVDEAMIPLRRSGLAPDRIDVADAGTGGTALGIDFLEAERPATAGPVRGPERLLLLTALCLAVAAIAIAVTRLEAAVEDVEARAATARVRYTRADENRRQLAEGEARRAALIALKTRETARVRVLEALTRLLPDTDYLTALRIEGNTLEIAGYAASTAALVPLIERSGVFRKAALTAPATYDDRAGRERFVLRAEISSVDAAIRPGGG